MKIELHKKPASEQGDTPQHFYHREQQRFVSSTARFEAACGGRRSGKSVIGRAKLVARAMRAHITHPHLQDYKAIIGAPTRDQVKRLHWRQTLALIPPAILRRCDISLSEMRIGLPSGVTIWFVGFDKPERAEGEAIDDSLLDEIADMKEEAWSLSVRPSLGTRGREGRCTFIGKPRGRNHWYYLWKEAAEKHGWDQFKWSAEDILTKEERDALKQDLDPISYDQEVRANFVNFSGRAYYAFYNDVHDLHTLQYEPGRPLDFTFDFNVDPGTAGVSQEQVCDQRMHFDPVWFEGEQVTPYIQGQYTAGIGEIWIGQNSNTRMVAKELVRQWAPVHKGVVNLYGDATGGARKTSALHGNDWDIIVREMEKVAHWKIKKHVPKSNPPERDRLNAVNTRFMASDGRVRCLWDRKKAPYHVADFEGVQLKQDGSGEIDKKKDPKLTHASDGFGYKVHRKFPVRIAPRRQTQL